MKRHIISVLMLTACQMGIMAQSADVDTRLQYLTTPYNGTSNALTDERLGNGRTLQSPPVGNYKVSVPINTGCVSTERQHPRV